MDHGHLSMVAETFQGVVAETLRTTCGKDTQLCRRQRTMTPLRLGLGLTATCASPRVETLADCHRGFQALCAPTIPDKAFSQQWAQRHCAPGMGTMASRLLGARTLQVLGVATGRACAACRHLVLQEGRALAIHDAWREGLPGRFTPVQPAAVALPPPMALRCEAPPPVVLTPDTPNDQACVPEPATRRGRGLLAERGSLDLPSLRRGQDAGGCLLLRAKAGMHPQVVEACRDDGKRLRSLRNTPRTAIPTTRPTRQRVARVGPWQGEASTLRLRLRIRWNRRTPECCSVGTTLPAKRSHLARLSRAYQGRWHVA